MKPLKLTINGINSFKDSQSLDFTRLSSSLFCISGDTGAGKSTILDAIILALYGECNRGDNQRGTDYINLERDKAEIEFAFQMEGTSYLICREFIKGNNGESKKKVKLFKDGNLFSSQLSEVSKLITDIVGLSMDDFTQVVVLEQGKFNRFLTATRKERSITVSKLFHLDKFRDLYSKTDKLLWGIKDNINGIELILSTYAEYTLDTLKENEKALKNTEGQIDSIDKNALLLSDKIKSLMQLKVLYEKSKAAAKRHDILVLEIEELQNQLKTLIPKLENDKDKYQSAKIQKEIYAVELDRLLNLAPRLNERTDCQQKLLNARAQYSELLKKVEALNKQTEEFTKTKTDAEERLNALSRQLLRLVDFKDFSDIKAACDSALKDFERAYDEALALTKEQSECQEAEKKHRQILLRYNKDIDCLKKEIEKESILLINASKLYQSKLTLNSAAFVASALKQGDKCPVCGGEFNGCNLKSCELDAAKKQEEDLRNTLKEKEGRLKEIEGLIKVELSAVMNEEQKKNNLEIKEKRHKKEYEGLKIKSIEDYNTLKILAKDALEWVEILADVSPKLDKALLDLKLNTSFLDQQRIKGTELKERIEALETEILQKGGDNPQKRQAELSKSLDSFTKFISDYEDTQRDTTNKINHINTSFAAKNQELTMLKDDIKQVDFSEEEFLQTDNLYKQLLKQKSELAEKTGTLKQIIQKSKQALAEKKLQECKLQELNKRADRLDKLKRLFVGERFLEFVADEYIAGFTGDASAILSDISGGKYALIYEGGEGKFYVEDYLNGAKRRKVSTLSGGEIFLASLSLALSIARHIASKSYDFFFLDEGFGTLDVKKMDMVAAALFKLARSGMVGVISHRYELVEKIPARIRVAAASEDTGSKILIEC